MQSSSQIITTNKPTPSFYRLDTNRPTPGFLANTTTPPQALWAYSSGCSVRGPLTCATSIHRLPPCIGTTQEANLIRPGFEQSTAISNHSTLDFTLHCGEQWIVLPGDALWKRLCSLSVPPDDDDDGCPSCRPTNSVKALKGK